MEFRHWTKCPESALSQPKGGLAYRRRNEQPNFECCYQTGVARSEKQARSGRLHSRPAPFQDGVGLLGGDFIFCEILDDVFGTVNVELKTS